MDELRDDYFGYRVTCEECGRIKAPLGRSCPLGYGGCDSECTGYYLEPLPSSLFPRESEADFGFKVSR